MNLNIDPQLVSDAIRSALGVAALVVLVAGCCLMVRTRPAEDER